jgi:hypothetical protein
MVVQNKQAASRQQAGQQASKPAALGDSSGKLPFGDDHWRQEISFETWARP